MKEDQIDNDLNAKNTVIIAKYVIDDDNKPIRNRPYKSQRLPSFGDFNFEDDED